MPLSHLTCPICLATLKPAQPVAEGTRVRCPKCKGAFVAEAEPKPDEPTAAPPEPEEVGQADDEVMEVVAADDEGERPRRRRPVRNDEEDEGPRRTTKKAVTPLWVWLTGGGVVLFLLCGCCGVGGMILYGNMLGANVSLANYNQIRRNMSETQVRAIMGSPTESTQVAGMHVDTWKNGDSFIVVSFANGRAVVGRCHITNGSGGFIDTSGALP